MVPIRVAVLGPAGTYTEKVAQEKWKNPALHYCENIPKVFKYMADGEAEYGIVPIEDSAEGDVNITLDLLRDYDFYIVGESFTEVTHTLLGKKDEKTLKKIGSHPQALAHCRKYLEISFPDIEQELEPSTAFAAKKASMDVTYGAIADERNAGIYGLTVLAREIHDWGSNLTRFITIAPKPITPTGRAKTSIIVYPRDDKPGQLFSVLKEFSEREINLTKIVSRPSRGRIEENVFYIDFEGNQTDSDIKSVLENIENLDTISAIRIFGSYPYSPPDSKPKEVVETVKEPESATLFARPFEFWDNPEDKIYESL
ncbi:MAG: prephenate dehydratase [Candidatus Hydrothermarchaeales archaeon]